MSHTPEPWEVTDLRYIRQSNEPRHVVARASKMDGMEANARRIVACVNACAGIETYALELMTGELSLLNQVTHKTRERPTKKAVQYRKQRDALLAALTEIAELDILKYHHAYAIAKGAIEEIEALKCSNS